MPPPHSPPHAGRRHPPAPRTGIRHRHAFTLTEVVLAIGVFAFAVVAVVGLLTPASRHVATAVESATATRLAEAVESELARIGFAAVRDFVCGDPVADGTNDVLQLVAPRDGSRVARTGVAGQGADRPPAAGGLGQGERFFLVEVDRLTTQTTDPLFFPSTPALRPGALALRIRVSWPHYIPAAAGDDAAAWDAPANAGTLVAPADRALLVLHTALRP